MICNDDQQPLPQAGLIASNRHRSPAVIVASDQMMNMEGSAAGANNLDRYIHALRRNWFWCLLLGGVLGGGVGAAIYSLVPNRFTAVAELRAYARPDRLIDSGPVQPTEKFETYISNAKQLLQSRIILNAAMNKGQLNTIPVIAKEIDDVGWLAKELKVSNPKDSEILLVSITVPDDLKAPARIVNAVVDAYMIEVDEKTKQKFDAKLKTLETVHSSLAADDKRLRSELEELAEVLGSVERDALTMQQQIQMEGAQHVKREYLKTGIELKHAEADWKVEVERLKNLDTQTIHQDELEVQVAMDPEGRLITDELNALSRAVEQAGAMTNNPNGASLSGLGGVRYRIVELKQQMETLKATLALKWRIERRNELEAAIQEKKALYDVLKDLCEKLKQDSDDYAKEVASIGSKSFAIDMKRKEIERLSQAIDEIAAEINVTKIEREGSARLEVNARAIDPKLANRPGPAVMAAASSLLAFLLPCVGLVFWDVRSQRVNTATEVSERLGLPIMGSVPILPSRITRSLGSSSPRGRWWQALLSESVAGIRANLLREDDVRVVMVTSAVGGEGKTTVATQLAMSLARAGKRTALVDFDLPRPSVSTVFNLALEPGICDVLRGECEIDDIVNDTVLPNLFVMPAGVADARTSQAMNSEVLPELIRELRDTFEYVIVDGSPLVPVADARVVSRYVDGAICCVLRDVSRLSLIRRASDILESFNVRLLGTVVTARQETYYMSRNMKNEEHALV